MLVGLMQPGTRAGVWTFAKWTDRLIPMSEVNEAWKKHVQSASKQITSPGQFTHVERVLEDAIKDWSGLPTTHNRHLVLLTDGMVDVSKVPGENEASRQRIIDDLLPKIKALGAKLHTVALSERADHELMKKLSGETDGWYQQVESADKLQRVFLKIFEQVSKPDSIPLSDNKFTVDSSIREATVLLFNKKGSPPPVLIAPNGEKFTDTDLPGGIAWFRDEGYELITISSPAKGEWSLQADIDPDNRVMIVTDLKLQTSEIPSHIAVGEAVMVSGNLTNRGKNVTRKAFLRVLDVRAFAMTPSGRDPQDLNDSGESGDVAASDGLYSMLFKEDSAFSDVELLFSVESPTFMREKRFHIAVHEPATLLIEGKGDVAKAIVKLESSVMREGAKISVWQDDPSGAISDLSATENTQSYVLANPAAGVYLKVEGQSVLGNLISREYGPIYAEGVEPPAVVEPEVEVPAEVIVEETVVEEEKPTEVVEDVAEQVVEEVVEEEDDTMMTVAIVGGANMLLILIGLGAWWIIRKRNKDDGESLADELDELDVDEESTSEDVAEKATEDSGEGEKEPSAEAAEEEVEADAESSEDKNKKGDNS